MKKRIKTNKKKGFMLIELIVVMAVIGILVLLAAPKFLGHTKEAQFAKHINNAKVLRDASERYYLDHGKWPRGADEDAYTPEEVSAYAERIYDFTGEELTLEEGNYWDIDYDALDKYAKLPDKSERANYVLRNPVGKVYYLEGLTEEGETRLPTEERPTEQESHEQWVAKRQSEGYVLATDSDFTKSATGNWRYTGTAAKVIIPHVIQDEPVTSYQYMFYQTNVSGVASDNPNITNMSFMFQHSTAAHIDLSHFETSNVTDMSFMFFLTKSTILDMRGFDTSNVINMSNMFGSSSAETLVMSNFDTSKTTKMRGMFGYSKATTLDLSRFNTSHVTDMASMFYGSSVITLDLRSFDTSNVTDMSLMFAELSMNDLDLTNFDTANVTDMNNMFYGSKATTLDLSSFDTSNVTNMSYMFGESQATTLDLSSFDTSKVTNKGYMFSGSKATTGYARNATEVSRLTTGTSKPSTLRFTVKP